VGRTGLTVATYERGIENETLSCGIGLTATAIAYHLQNPIQKVIGILTKGGRLQVKLTPTENGFDDISLCGSTQQVLGDSFKVSCPKISQTQFSESGGH